MEIALTPDPRSDPTCISKFCSRNLHRMHPTPMACSSCGSCLLTAVGPSANCSAGATSTQPSKWQSTSMQPARTAMSGYTPANRAQLAQVRPLMSNGPTGSSSIAMMAMHRPNCWNCPSHRTSSLRPVHGPHSGCTATTCSRHPRPIWRPYTARQEALATAVGGDKRQRRTAHHEASRDGQLPLQR